MQLRISPELFLLLTAVLPVYKTNLANLKQLQGQLTYLVPFGERHFCDKRYLSWLADYEVMKTINRPEYLKPIAFEEVREYCENLMQSKTDLFLAIYYKAEDLFVGTLRISSINHYAKTADIGILVGDRSKWGKGIATDVIHTVCRYLFDELGMRKLTAGVMGINLPMLKVFKKLGFQKEGVFRQQDRFENGYCDHIYLGCFKDEFESSL